MPGAVKVFGSPTSAEVARVLACLFEKDVEFQLIRVDSFRGAKRMPQYLKLQPHGEALTFEDGNVTLVESRKILRHIADKYKDQGNTELIGTGALERSSIEQWLQTEAQSFDVPSADLVYSLAFLPPPPAQAQLGGGKAKGAECDEQDGGGERQGRGGGGRNGEMNPAHRQKVEEMRQLFEKSRKELNKVLDIYEQRLDEAEYLAGDKFTLADLSHLPKADALASDPRSLSMIQSRRNVSRWWADISGRESWKYIKSLNRPPSAEAPF
ncbi:glutathione S-transferase F11-like [Oryza brachyantha]|uniref:glutathione transferase n=1 Tax=Oryza brachyantha TaxID=4533 RepID=J3N4K1_ORYBR|nr:glutathione S-transferase F11-like [Oryza brachyantha]